MDLGDGDGGGMWEGRVEGEGREGSLDHTRLRLGLWWSEWVEWTRVAGANEMWGRDQEEGREREGSNVGRCFVWW